MDTLKEFYTNHYVVFAIIIIFIIYIVHSMYFENYEQDPEDQITEGATVKNEVKNLAEVAVKEIQKIAKDPTNIITSIIHVGNTAVLTITSVATHVVTKVAVPLSMATLLQVNDTVLDIAKVIGKASKKIESYTN